MGSCEPLSHTCLKKAKTLSCQEKNNMTKSRHGGICPPPTWPFQWKIYRILGKKNIEIPLNFLYVQSILSIGKCSMENMEKPSPFFPPFLHPLNAQKARSSQVCWSSEVSVAGPFSTAMADATAKQSQIFWYGWYDHENMHTHIYIYTLYTRLLCMYIYIYTCTYSGHVTQKCLVLVFGMAAHDFYWDGVHVVHGDLINCGSSSVKGVPIFKKQSGLPHCHWGVRIILYNGSDLGVPQ
jgi:hypothetical protein